jgi:hypothetical protein
MWEKSNLTMLPAHGKLFVGLFTALMVAVFLWAGTLATLESGIFGDDEDEKAAVEDYDYQADMDTIQADSLAVTAPDWSDSGQEEPINEDDLGGFSETPEKTTWQKFEDNLKLSHVHLNGHTALYFALGAIFFFSTATPSRKKLAYWIFGIAIFIHTLGLLALDTCPYGKILAMIGGAPLLLSILYMVIVIFSDLRKKA